MTTPAKRIVNPQRGKLQAAPWKAANTDPEVALPIWEDICEQRQNRKLLAREGKIEDEMRTYYRTTLDWWILLGALDRVRKDNIERGLIKIPCEVDP